MAVKPARPWGVTIIAGGTTMIGGIATFVLLFDVIDSWRLFGARSLLIPSFEAFWGFLFYGAVPVLFYVIGIGLFVLQPWARRLALALIPPVVFYFFLNFAVNTVRFDYGMFNEPLGTLYASHPETFYRVFLVYFLIILPFITYFRLPRVRQSFEIAAQK